MDFPKYDNYKDSGVGSFGRIPDHWDLQPICAVSKLKSVRGCADRELLSVYLDRGVIKFSDVDEKRTNATSTDLSNYQAVDPGDFVLNNQQAWRGSVGVSTHQGIVSPAYIILSLSGQWNPTYANYLLRDSAMVAQYLIYSKGVGTIQRNLYYPDFKRASIILPPKHEQDRIVDFLDRKTAEIDELIAKKERQIELLEEQKAIRINQAVTRGLNPDVKLKPSGIEWIGDIPEHWKPIRFKFCSSGMEQGWSPQCDNRLANDGAWGVVKVGCVNGYKFRSEEHKSIPKTIKPDLRYEIQSGDFLISRANSRELVGSAAIATESKWRLMLCDKIYRCSISESKLIPEFGIAVIQIRPSREQLEIGANGASDSMQNISQDVVKDLWFGLPPRHEQKSILAHLLDAEKRHRAVLQSEESQIQSLKTLRSTLIAHAVTGKIRV